MVSQWRAATSSVIAWLTWAFRLSQTRTSGPPSCWRAASAIVTEVIAVGEPVRAAAAAA